MFVLFFFTQVCLHLISVIALFCACGMALSCNERPGGKQKNCID